MSSTRKTDNLHLNQWIGADIPKRDDFNADNATIDSVITNHKSNTDIHTTAAEKHIWDTPYAMRTYFGNGAAQQVVDLECDFEPRFVIVFGVGNPVSVMDVDNEADYNYFGVATRLGSMPGITLTTNKLYVQQSGVPVQSTEYKNFNQSGVVYIALLFR